MPELVRMSISLEEPLYKRLDKLVRESGYSNRSEYVRDMVRERLVEREWDKNGEVLATLTIVYDHHARGLIDKLVGLQHDYGGAVLATTHVHLDHHHCAEMIMMRGRAGEIQKLAGEMRKLKGVLHAELAMGSTGKGLA